MIFLNKSKRRFLVCACISIIASAKTYGMDSKPVGSERSESETIKDETIEFNTEFDKPKIEPVEENISSMEADTKKEGEGEKEKPIKEEEIIEIENESRFDESVSKPVEENPSSMEADRKKEDEKQKEKTTEKEEIIIESGHGFDFDESESKPVEENISSMERGMKKEDEGEKEETIEINERIDFAEDKKDDGEEDNRDTSIKYGREKSKSATSEEVSEYDKFSKLQTDLEQYKEHSQQFNVVAHEVIAREGGYKNMGECLFGYDNDNKDEIKDYIEKDDLYRHIMFEIDSIRSEYKDRDYATEGGWAAIGANPSFYSKDNKEIDVARYHEGEVRAPIGDEKDFTNTFRTIGLYIRNYVYYLSYMTLFKNGKDLENKDAAILKHYVQRIIDDDDTYETAYTKKYLFDRIGEILSDNIFSKDHSILNPEDVKKLEELAEGIKNKHEPLGEGTSVPVSGNYEDEDKLNFINETIENNIETSYFKIIENDLLISTMFSGRPGSVLRELLSKLGVRYSVTDEIVYNRYAQPVGDKVDKHGTIITALTDCIEKIQACMKTNNQVSGDFMPAILESIGKKDNKELGKLIYKVSTIHNELNAFNSLYDFDSRYIIDPENVIAVNGTANTFGRTNIPAMGIVPEEKLSVTTLVKNILLNTDNLRDLLEQDFSSADINNTIWHAVLNSKNILTDFDTDFDHATQDNPKFVCQVPDETKVEASEDILNDDPFANLDPVVHIAQQTLVDQIKASVKKMSSISGRQYLILKKIFQSLNRNLDIVIWDGNKVASIFSDEGEEFLLKENILDEDILRTTYKYLKINGDSFRTVDQVDPTKFVVYPTNNSIKTISQLKEFKQLGEKIGTELLLKVFENSPKLTKTNPDLCASILLMINLQDISEEFLPHKDYENYFYNPYNEFFTDAEESLDELYQHNDGIRARVEHGYIYDSDSRRFVESELDNEALKKYTKKLFQEKTSIEQENENLTEQLEDLKKEIRVGNNEILELKNKILELEDKIKSLNPEVEKPEKKDFESEAK